MQLPYMSSVIKYNKQFEANYYLIKLMIVTYILCVFACA